MVGCTVKNLWSCKGEGMSKIRAGKLKAMHLKIRETAAVKDCYVNDMTRKVTRAVEPLYSELLK